MNHRLKDNEEELNDQVFYAYKFCSPLPISTRLIKNTKTLNIRIAKFTSRASAMKLTYPTISLLACYFAFALGSPQQELVPNGDFFFSYRD